MNKIKIFIGIIFVFPVMLSASIHETLPTWHWAYEYIDALRLRGGFEALYTMNRPYTRGNVAKSLIQYV